MDCRSNYAEKFLQNRKRSIAEYLKSRQIKIRIHLRRLYQRLRQTSTKSKIYVVTMWMENESKSLFCWSLVCQPPAPWNHIVCWCVNPQRHEIILFAGVSTPNAMKSYCLHYQQIIVNSLVVNSFPTLTVIKYTP